MFAEFDPHAMQPGIGYWASLFGGYVILLPGAELVAFLLTWILIRKGNRPFADMAMLLVAPMPLFFSVVGALHRLVATAHGLALQKHAVPEGVWLLVGHALLFVMLGMLLSIPSYIACVIGLVRQFNHEHHRQLTVAEHR